MKQEIGEYLELPGNVVLIEPITKAAAIKEIGALIDKYEGADGCLTMGDLPEGEDKDRLRTLFRVLGLDVRF